MIARRASHEHFPKWPADCFDGRPLESLTIPPGKRKVLVCEDYPDCGCEGDCELPPLRTGGSERVLMLVLLALMIAGAGLIWLLLRL